MRRSPAKVIYTSFLLLTLLLGLPGCAAFREFSSSMDAGPLAEAQDLFDQGKYPEAIEAYRQIVRDHPSTRLAAEAQFRIGHTLSYFKNPQPNYAEAVKEFQQVLNQFPKSERADEARNWISTLSLLVQLQHDLQQLMKLDIESEKRRKQLK